MITGRVVAEELGMLGEVVNSMAMVRVYLYLVIDGEEGNEVG